MSQVTINTEDQIVRVTLNEEGDPVSVLIGDYGVTTYQNGTQIQKNSHNIDFLDGNGTNAIVTLSNGRSLVSHNLGGTLNQNTQILGAGIYGLTLGDLTDPTKYLSYLYGIVPNTGDIYWAVKNASTGGETSLYLKGTGSNRFLATSDNGMVFITTSGGIGSIAATTQQLIAGTTLTLGASVGNFTMTTVGGNLFSLTNPSAVTWPRLNADNTVSALSANNTLNALLPSQTGNSGKFLTTDGTNTSWATVTSGGNLTIGTTTISSGTTTYLLYDNAGVLGEYPIGTGVSTFLGTPSWTNFNSMITGTAPFWSLASGGTATGNNTLTFGSNTLTFTGNSHTTGTLATFSSSSLTSGTGFMVDITGTAALTGSKAIYGKQSGANASGSQTTYSGYFENIRTGSGTNVGVFGKASGGTFNYAGSFDGNVIVGTTPLTSPFPQFQVTYSAASGDRTGVYILNNTSGAGAYTELALSNSSGDNSNLFLTSAGWTPTGIPARALGFANSGVGGISIAAFNASGVIRFLTAGTATTNQRLSIDQNGTSDFTPNITTQNGLTVTSSTATTGFLAKYTSTSTVINHTAGTHALVGVDASGANSTSGKTVVGFMSKVANTGTSSTNISGLFGASGANINYGIVSGLSTSLATSITNDVGFSTNILVGSGTTINTAALSTYNSSGTRIISLTDGGYIRFGASGGNGSIYTQSQGSPSLTGNGLAFEAPAGTTSNGMSFYFTSGTHTLTAGTTSLIRNINTFSASSGDAAYKTWWMQHTINQSGTATGTMTDLHIAPVHTNMVGTKIGIDYSPTNTSVTGTHYAWRSTSGSFLITETARAVAWTPVIKITPGAHTALTAATEFVSSDFLGATQTWADGTVATQRFAYFRAFTLNKTTSAATFTDTYRAYFEKSVAGSGVTLTRNWSVGMDGNLQVQGSIYLGAASVAPTAFLHIDAGVTGNAQIRLAAGVAPSSPNDGDIYYVDTNDRLMFRNSADVEFLLASAVNSVSPTSPNRTITVVHNGTTYYIAAKTTND